MALYARVTRAYFSACWNSCGRMSGRGRMHLNDLCLLLFYSSDGILMTIDRRRNQSGGSTGGATKSDALRSRRRTGSLSSAGGPGGSGSLIPGGTSAFPRCPVPRHNGVATLAFTRPRQKTSQGTRGRYRSDSESSTSITPTLPSTAAASSAASTLTVIRGHCAEGPHNAP